MYDLWKKAQLLTVVKYLRLKIVKHVQCINKTIFAVYFVKGIENNIFPCYHCIMEKQEHLGTVNQRNGYEVKQISSIYVFARVFSLECKQTTIGFELC